MSTRYSFSVKYKGNNHCGWQYGRTKKLRGVSNNLNKSLRRSTNGLPLLVAGSGRTDSGVHGLRQAAQVDLVRQKKNFVFDINDLSPDELHLHHHLAFVKTDSNGIPQSTERRHFELTKTTSVEHNVAKFHKLHHPAQNNAHTPNNKRKGGVVVEKPKNPYHTTKYLHRKYVVGGETSKKTAQPTTTATSTTTSPPHPTPPQLLTTTDPITQHILSMIDNIHEQNDKIYNTSLQMFNPAYNHFVRSQLLLQNCIKDEYTHLYHDQLKLSQDVLQTKQYNTKNNKHNKLKRELDNNTNNNNPHDPQLIETIHGTNLLALQPPLPPQQLERLTNQFLLGDIPFSTNLSNISSSSQHHKNAKNNNNTKGNAQGETHTTSTSDDIEGEESNAEKLRLKTIVDMDMCDIEEQSEDDSPLFAGRVQSHAAQQQPPKTPFSYGSVAIYETTIDAPPHVPNYQSDLFIYQHKQQHKQQEPQQQQPQQIMEEHQQVHQQEQQNNKNPNNNNTTKKNNNTSLPPTSLSQTDLHLLATLPSHKLPLHVRFDAYKRQYKFRIHFSTVYDPFDYTHKRDGDVVEKESIIQHAQHKQKQKRQRLREGGEEEENDNNNNNNFNNNTITSTINNPATTWQLPASAVASSGEGGDNDEDENDQVEDVHVDLASYGGPFTSSPAISPLLKTFNFANAYRVAQKLTGKHNYHAFRNKECQADSPIRRVDNIAFHLEQSFADNLVHSTYYGGVSGGGAENNGYQSAHSMSGQNFNGNNNNQNNQNNTPPPQVYNYLNTAGVEQYRAVGYKPTFHASCRAVIADIISCLIRDFYQPNATNNNTPSSLSSPAALLNTGENPYQYDLFNINLGQEEIRNDQHNEQQQFQKQQTQQQFNFNTAANQRYTDYGEFHKDLTSLLSLFEVPGPSIKVQPDSAATLKNANHNNTNNNNNNYQDYLLKPNTHYEELLRNPKLIHTLLNNTPHALLSADDKSLLSTLFEQTNQQLYLQPINVSNDEITPTRTYQDQILAEHELMARGDGEYVKNVVEKFKTFYKHKQPQSNVLIIEFTAGAYLHNQVRIMTSAIIEAGLVREQKEMTLEQQQQQTKFRQRQIKKRQQHTTPPHKVVEGLLLAGTDRGTNPFKTAPPEGLFLTNIYFPHQQQPPHRPQQQQQQQEQSTPSMITISDYDLGYNNPQFNVSMWRRLKDIQQGLVRKLPKASVI